MINSLRIERFMDMIDETLEIKPLTVITGINSAGKSAVIQAILAVLKQADAQGKLLLKPFDFGFKGAVCKYDAFDNYKISVSTDGGDIVLTVNAEDENPALGDKEKDTPIALKLNGDEEQKTLGSQVDYWLKEILGMKFTVKTEEKNSNIILSYDADEVKDLMPNQLGTAVSYLAKALIMCLRAKPGDVLMIENPEIHLHPMAQGKLGAFLTMITNAGVQLIVETHSEHIINKIQYQIFSKKFDADNLSIYYKNDARVSFEKIVIDGNGRYSEDFPEGFFDASLAELMEIG